MTWKTKTWVSRTKKQFVVNVSPSLSPETLVEWHKLILIFLLAITVISWRGASDYTLVSSCLNIA
jgi:hypothetical protein